MPRPSPALFVAALALVACDDGAPAAGGVPQAGGKWRVVDIPTRDVGDAMTLAPRFTGNGALAAVVAFDAASTTLLQSLRNKVATAPVPLFGVEGGTWKPAPGDTVVAEPKPAPIAIEMALLACHGVGLPPRMLVGPVLPGGVHRPAPGDLGLAMLRREHAKVLTTTPDVDVVFALSCVVWRADPWHHRVRDELVAEAKRYPQLALDVQSADGDADRLRTLVQKALAANVRAILFVADHWSAMASSVAPCDEQHIVRIGIDPYAAASHVTCCVGTDPQILGQALGEILRAHAPVDGAILVGDDPSPEAARRTGFLKALGLQAK